MNNGSEKEVLDFCRAKKIFEKGFGFLTSLYYNENVFFHFSKIRDTEKRESLQAMQRGVVSIFFTSKSENGKRKANKVWLTVEEIPKHFLPDFINRLVLELNDGQTNPYEIIDALNQLRRSHKLTENNYHEILCSSKIKKNPSILLKLISDDEFSLQNELKDILKEWSENYPSKVENNRILVDKLLHSY